jgi:hypothetical protein
MTADVFTCRIEIDMPQSVVCCLLYVLCIYFDEVHKPDLCKATMAGTPGFVHSKTLLSTRKQQSHQTTPDMAAVVVSQGVLVPCGVGYQSQAALVGWHCGTYLCMHCCVLHAVTIELLYGCHEDVLIRISIPSTAV